MSREPSECDGQQRACCVTECHITTSTSSDARPAGDSGSGSVGICKTPTSIHIADSNNKHQNTQELPAPPTSFQTLPAPSRARMTCDTHLPPASKSQCVRAFPPQSIVVGLVLVVEETISMRRSAARMLRRVPDHHQHQQRCAASM